MLTLSNSLPNFVQYVLVFIGIIVCYSFMAGITHIILVKTLKLNLEHQDERHMGVILSIIWPISLSIFIMYLIGYGPWCLANAIPSYIKKLWGKTMWKLELRK